MSSQSLASVAVASLFFAGCTVQPRVAASAPAVPVAAAPAPAPAVPASAKAEASKNGCQKAVSAATDALDYAAVKRASKKGYDGMTAIHNKTVQSGREEHGQTRLLHHEALRQHLLQLRVARAWFEARPDDRHYQYLRVLRRRLQGPLDRPRELRASLI